MSMTPLSTSDTTRLLYYCNTVRLYKAVLEVTGGTERNQTVVITYSEEELQSLSDSAHRIMELRKEGVHTRRRPSVVLYSFSTYPRQRPHTTHAAHRTSAAHLHTPPTPLLGIAFDACAVRLCALASPSPRRRGRAKHRDAVPFLHACVNAWIELQSADLVECHLEDER